MAWHGVNRHPTYHYPPFLRDAANMGLGAVSHHRVDVWATWHPSKNEKGALKTDIRRTPDSVRISSSSANLPPLLCHFGSSLSLFSIMVGVSAKGERGDEHGALALRAAGKRHGAWRADTAWHGLQPGDGGRRDERHQGMTTCLRYLSWNGR